MSVAVATLLFTGCGGGGGSSEDTTTNNTTTQETTTSDLSGNAIDGYIKNALVKIGTLTASTPDFPKAPQLNFSKTPKIKVSKVSKNCSIYSKL